MYIGVKERRTTLQSCVTLKNQLDHFKLNFAHVLSCIFNLNFFFRSLKMPCGNGLNKPLYNFFILF